METNDFEKELSVSFKKFVIAKKFLKDAGLEDNHSILEYLKWMQLEKLAVSLDGINFNFDGDWNMSEIPENISYLGEQVEDIKNIVKKLYDID